MRDIRFRAWLPKGYFADKELCKMVYGVCVSASGKLMELEGGWDYQSDSDTAILMQYTGLLDKNGKEIYEGDIWKFEDERGRRFGKVVYQNGMFVVHTQQLEGKLLETWNGHNMPHGEIIGNIYENPELLNA